MSFIQPLQHIHIVHECYVFYDKCVLYILHIDVNMHT